MASEQNTGTETRSRGDQGAFDARWQQLRELMNQHQDLFTYEFLDQFYNGLLDLASGSAEQLCLRRQARTSSIEVQTNVLTTGAGAGGVARQTGRV